MVHMKRLNFSFVISDIAITLLDKKLAYKSLISRVMRNVLQRTVRLGV
jgi:hypothetical protein